MDSFINPTIFENFTKIYDVEQIIPPSSCSSSCYFEFRNCWGGVADGHPRRHRGQALQTVVLQLFLQSLQAIKATGTMGRALSSSPCAARLYAS
jgi:hypothetical protein